MMSEGRDHRGDSHYLVIGATGQIGVRLSQHLGHHGQVYTPRIPWSRRDVLPTVLHRTIQDFASRHGRNSWGIAWVAGAATTVSSEYEARDELAAFRAFVAAVNGAKFAVRGVVFVGSSAGGVYAGAHSPPFDCHSTPAPISPYGRLKVAQEQIAATELKHVASVILGRMANIYGPTQRANKSQGIITQLCRAAAIRRPLSVFVPFDTLRDYLFVEDAASIIANLIGSELEHSSIGDPRIDIIASGEAHSIRSLIRNVEDVTHRRVPIAHGITLQALHQARDLRLTPSPNVAQHLDYVTPLPVGIRRTYDALVTQVLSPMHS